MDGSCSGDCQIAKRLDTGRSQVSQGTFPGMISSKAFHAERSYSSGQYIAGAPLKRIPAHLAGSPSATEVICERTIFSHRDPGIPLF